MRANAHNITKYAVLIATALAISVFEGWLPPAFIPLPGVKLGLSNIVTLFTLYTLGALPAVIVLICRCFLASLFGGGVTAFAFSICGGLLALSVMKALMNCGALSIVGVSIAGAAAHGIGQIAVAMLMLSSFSAVFYLPLLLFSAIFTGTITALISSVIIPRLKKYV